MISNGAPCSRTNFASSSSDHSSSGHPTPRRSRRLGPSRRSSISADSRAIPPPSPVAVTAESSSPWRASIKYSWGLIMLIWRCGQTAGNVRLRLALDADQTRAYVANTLDDTISVFDLKSGKRLALIPLGPRHDPSLEERGERLFYDARLSRGGWMSCHSCHTDGHSNGLNVDTIGDGGYGAPKRVPSLLGTSQSGPGVGPDGMSGLMNRCINRLATTVQGFGRPRVRWPSYPHSCGRCRCRTSPVPPSKVESARRGESLFNATAPPVMRSRSPRRPLATMWGWPTRLGRPGSIPFASRGRIFALRSCMMGEPRPWTRSFASTSTHTTRTGRPKRSVTCSRSSNHFDASSQASRVSREA